MVKFHHLALKPGWNSQKMFRKWGLPVTERKHWRERNMSSLGVCNTVSTGPWMDADTILGPGGHHWEGRAQLHHGFERGSPRCRGCSATYYPWPTSPEALVLDSGCGRPSLKFSLGSSPVFKLPLRSKSDSQLVFRSGAPATQGDSTGKNTSKFLLFPWLLLNPKLLETA